MILRSALILRRIYILCAFRWILVRGASYTKDQLLNVDLEPIDTEPGGVLYRFDGKWDQKKRIYWRLQNDPYWNNRIEEMLKIGNDAQDVLNTQKQWFTFNDTDPYYFTMAKKNQDYFQLVVDSITVNVERLMVTSGEHEKQRMRQCFAIVNTMLNSRLDIQRYYKVRYLYSWTLHFEIGYLSQEILRHYTVVIDLFHLVVTRFHKQVFDDHTPARYMLYMYSIILQECKMIIKLCHMIREVEKKYGNFEDQTKLWRETPGSAEQLKNAQKAQKEINAKAWAMYNAELEKARKEKMKALKKKNKKFLDRYNQSASTLNKGKKIPSGSGFSATGSKGSKQTSNQWKPADYFYISVNASNQKKGPFPHIYGWSIENW